MVSGYGYIMAVTVTIAGSYRKHFDRLVDAKQRFEALGAEVLRPHSTTISSTDEELVRLEGDPDDARAVQAAQFSAISRSQLLYVVNPGGYVGASATLEIGYAFRQGALIVTAEQAFEAVVATIARVGLPEQALTWQMTDEQ
jgi:hypothetical protein